MSSFDLFPEVIIHPGLVGGRAGLKSFGVDFYNFFDGFRLCSVLLNKISNGLIIFSFPVEYLVDGHPPSSGVVGGGTSFDFLYILNAHILMVVNVFVMTAVKSAHLFQALCFLLQSPGPPSLQCIVTLLLLFRKMKKDKEEGKTQVDMLEYVSKYH